MVQLSKNNKRNIKWFIGILITVLGASGGIVEILEYTDIKKQTEIKDEVIKKQKEEKEYQAKLRKWEDFSPKSIIALTKNLKGGNYLDLERGREPNSYEQNKSDIIFGKGSKGDEYLRALKKVSWSDRGHINFDKITYREIRDAKYSSPKHNKTNYPDLFYAFGSGLPSKGHVYFIKTIEGNVAKIQIRGYKSVSNNPLIARNIIIKYKVFPIVKDPIKPKK